MVGTSALRAIRLAILFLVFSSTQLFAQPTSYECAPGTPKRGVGCNCPATHSPRLDGGGAATCVVKKANPNPYYGGYNKQQYTQWVSKGNDAADAYNCVKAEEFYAKALAIYARGVEALVGSGNCLARQSKWTNAHVKFDKALSIDRKYEPALWGKAEAYRLAYKKDDAIAAYKQYLVYYPGTIKATQALEKLGVGSGTTITTGGNRPGRYPSRTQDVWISVSGRSITINGVAVSGKPRYSDLEGIFGKPDRVWDTKGGVNKVHTWDRLGLVVYEPMDNSGKAISLTMPYKPMGMAYDPSTNFAGSISIDGFSLYGSTRLATVITKPGVTQPYSSTSAIWAKGDFNVFMTGRNGPLDLVELSLWKDAPTGVVTTTGGGGRYKTTRELKITVNNGTVRLNGTWVSGKPKMADIERIYGKWDRIWDTGSSNRVYTWDNLGLVAYENRDASGNPTGNCISTTFPYKKMGSSYDPSTMFDGSITVDGRAMTKYNTIGTIKTRPNAGQPYGKDSIVFDWGDVHVFTIAKSGGAIDLVEVSYWNKDRGMSTKGSGGGKVANAADVRVEVSRTGAVTIQGTAISGKPLVSDFKRIFGEPDRVWDKKGGANRIHTWDRLGIILYEPYNGRAISLTMPYKKMSGDFSPSTMFKGRVSLDGRGFYNFNTIGTIKNRTGAKQPYGATSVVFDFGDVHVFTTAPAATTQTIDLVEVSFWNKNR